MSKVIEAISTITAKGQATVPKVVRQILGIGYGGKLVTATASGQFTYSPDSSYIESDSFTYSASDQSSGQSSNVANVNIVVKATPVTALKANALTITGYADSKLAGSLSETDALGHPIQYTISS